MSTSPHFRHIAPGAHITAYRLNTKARTADFITQVRGESVRHHCPSWKFMALWANKPTLAQQMYRAYHQWRLNRRLAKIVARV